MKYPRTINIIIVTIGTSKVDAYTRTINDDDEATIFINKLNLSDFDGDVATEEIVLNGNERTLVAYSLDKTKVCTTILS